MTRIEAALIAALWSGALAILLGIAVENDTLIVLGITFAFGSGIFLMGDFFPEKDGD